MIFQKKRDKTLAKKLRKSYNKKGKCEESVKSS